MIIEGKDVAHRIEETTEVCIIGSGAAGAILAWELADKGHDVLLIEKGGYFPKESITQKEDEMIPRLYKNGGPQFAIPSSIAIAQGSCVGGSTIVNDAVCFRTPDLVLEKWMSEFRIENIDPNDMKRYFERIEKRLSVSEVRPEEINKNNQMLKRGCEKLGWEAGPNRRNCKECRLCGLCHLGCSYGTKQNMLETYIHDTERFHDQSVRIYANCSAQTLVVSGNKVRGVRASISARGHRVPISVRAEVVIVSAGTFASSELLMRSKLNRSGLVGKHVALHPSPAIIADFEEEIDGIEGIPMAYHCREFSILKTGKRGYFIESHFLAPYQFALILPGLIYENKELMKRYNHYALAGILLQDEPVGKMTLGGPMGPLIFYSLTSGDGRMMMEGMKNTARIFFAAGATRVITSHRRQTILYGEDDLPLIEERGVGPMVINLVSGHPQGGNRMGGDSRSSVVDSYGKVHGFENLFVSDASVFPTSVGVNPQLTVMALAMRTAEHINDNWNKLAKAS